MRTPSTTRTRHLSRATAAGAAAFTGLVLAFATTAGPAQAVDAIPATDAEAKQFVEDRQAEDSSALSANEVPKSVSLDEARDVVDESDEITSADIEYAAALEDLPEDGSAEDFYASPAQLPEEDGALIKQKSASFYLDPVKLIRHDAETTTFMYRTTDEHGEARAATATLLTPSDKVGEHAENVVVHAPGTQGIDDSCAPSRQLGMGTEYEGISVASALAAGHSVVIADYVGLGTEGPHSYLNSTEEGRSVLDAARAAQQVEGGGIDEESRLQLRGYSQGGHATTAALEIADEWAPELNIVSASAGAVPTDLEEVVTGVSAMQTGLLVLGLSSFAEQAEVDLSELLNEEGLETVERTSGQCTIAALLSNAFSDTTELTKDGRSFAELVGDERFAEVLREQKLGDGPTPDVPVLVNHSRLDDVVPFEMGRGLAATWCRDGADVAFEDNIAPTHIGGYIGALPRVEIFTARTFDGKRPLNSCWRL